MKKIAFFYLLWGISALCFAQSATLDISLNGAKTYIGCINNILYVIAFYTLRERIRIISARRADNDEQEEYDGYFKKIKS